MWKWVWGLTFNSWMQEVLCHRGAKDLIYRYLTLTGCIYTTWSRGLSFEYASWDQCTYQQRGADEVCQSYSLTSLRRRFVSLLMCCFLVLNLDCPPLLSHGKCLTGPLDLDSVVVSVACLHSGLTYLMLLSNRHIACIALYASVESS